MAEDDDEERGEQVFVNIPGITGPTDLETRFTYPLDDEFLKNKFGEYRRRHLVHNRETGENECRLEIGLFRPIWGMNFLREFFQRRNCPPGTEIFYPKNGLQLSDVFNGTEWVLGNPDTVMRLNPGD